VLAGLVERVTYNNFGAKENAAHDEIVFADDLAAMKRQIDDGTGF
jgi:hypothetical protein